ncbi:MAG: hypothetical protein WC107_01660 [Patescibacteria group bacterium]
MTKGTQGKTLRESLVCTQSNGYVLLTWQGLPASRAGELTVTENVIQFPDQTLAYMKETGEIFNCTNLISSEAITFIAAVLALDGVEKLIVSRYSAIIFFGGQYWHGCSEECRMLCEKTVRDIAE